MRTTHEDRITSLEREVIALKQEAAETTAAAKETHDAVQQLCEALLKPQPGHERSLLERVAQVTIRAERGEWALHVVFWLIGAGATIAAAWAAFKTWATGG